ncbi:MAG TPA: YihY family inner membrane protein [Nitrospinota bacterium]|nr:YihY family inner membrane protein [Nitrospinota bacterium]|tara:strand:- start:148730 stop:150088 length:1359 start_codon:yes stop_codon:yes gene_type:complete
MNEQTTGPTFFGRVISALQTEGYSLIRNFVWQVKLLYEIIEKFYQDNCFMYAASLAYSTLLALVPLAAVSISILSSLDYSKDTVMNFFFKHFLPNEELALIIESNIDGFAANAASVSMFGAVALILFCIWVLSGIESAFNMIWKVDKPRPIFNQFVAYWSSITFTPILLAVSIIVTVKIQTMIQSDALTNFNILQSFTLKSIPFVLTWIAFFLIYKLVPNTNVRFFPALVGSLAGGTLFELAKLGFNSYVSNWSVYTVVYGALAVVPIFLFWLYITWLIVLLGSIISYAIQYPKEIDSIKNHRFDRSKYINYYALRVLFDCTRTFIDNKGPLTTKVLLKKLEITEEFYDDILEKLEHLGCIEFTDKQDQKFLFSRPPQNIYLADVLIDLNEDMFSVSPAPIDEDRESLRAVFTKMKNSFGSGINNINLLDLTKEIIKEENSTPPDKLLKDNG